MVNVWTSSPGVHDLLTQATDGMGSASSVEYKTLADSSIYSKSEPGDTVVANAIDPMVPMSVASSASYDDGLGGRYTINYQYNGLKADPLRGFLGFRWVKSTDTRTLIWNKTTFRQDFPFTGMMEQTESRQGNGLPLSIARTTTHVDRQQYNGQVHFLFAQESSAETYELDGTLTTKTATRNNDMDNYGNARNITVSSLDGSSKTTVSTYDINDVDKANWRIGKLRSSTVTSSAPGQPDIVRKSGFDYAPNGQVGSETIEPDNTALSADTAYLYDQFGNSHISTTSGPDIEPRSTITNYDERGRFVQSTQNALGQTESHKYDERWGALTFVKGPNNLATTTVYDDFGRKRLETRADGSRTIITYEKASADPDSPAAAIYLVRSTSDGAASLTAYFDRLGREIRKKTLSAVGSSGQSQVVFVDTIYNSLGQVEAVTRPYFAGSTPSLTRSFYDLAGRVYRVETPKESGGVAVAVNLFHGLSVDSINP